MAFIASITIANCSVLEILEDPKSRCPKYWVDATHVDMVRFFSFHFGGVQKLRGQIFGIF